MLAFAATAVAEEVLPFRGLSSSTPRRWLSNSTLFVLSSAVMRCVSGIAFALMIRAVSYGVLNRVAVPYSVQFAVGFAALDLTTYISHRLLHAYNPMWRVHQVHHSETDMDLTTGIRFHPIETLLQQGLSLVTIALLGIPPGVLGIAALVFVVQDFFVHANLRIPESADRMLRLLIVTPAMHRAHHSEAIPQQNTNFGTVFSLWDRLFGTYLAGHLPGVSQERCGLVEMPNGSEVSAARLLFLPFRRTSRENLLADTKKPIISIRERMNAAAPPPDQVLLEIGPSSNTKTLSGR